MSKVCLKITVFFILGCIFVFYVHDGTEKYLKKATSLANSIEKAERLKLPHITFCPGIKRDQLEVGMKSTVNHETFFTYFDYSEKNVTTEAEIQDWWDRINFRFEEIFIRLGFNSLSTFNTRVYTSKEGLQDANSNVALVEMTSSFGRCFSFEVLDHTTNMESINFDLNFTNLEHVWIYFHNKNEELGLFMNFWFTDVQIQKVSRNKIYDFPTTMRHTKFMKSDSFPCQERNNISSHSQCVFQQTQRNFRTWDKDCPIKCSIPQSQLVQDEQTSNMSLCTTKQDSDCSRYHLFKNVITHIFKASESCPKDCSTSKYQIKAREDMSNLKTSNTTKIYFYWEDTNYTQEHEYLIFDLGTIIGTVGGSLGLFLGFSCRGVIDLMLDMIWVLHTRFGQKGSINVNT